jgi:hypothetical protein
MNDFFYGNHEREIMYPIKEMKKYKYWRREYRDMLEVKRVNICKSCEKNGRKGVAKNIVRKIGFRY